MFENPRRGRQAKNFTTNVPKILDLKSSSEQIFSRKLSLGAPGGCINEKTLEGMKEFGKHTRSVKWFLFRARLNITFKCNKTILTITAY